MKQRLIVITFLIGLFACHEDNPNNNYESVSIRKVTDIPFDSASLRHGTTLDSLQGTWISNTDTKVLLMIQSHSRADIYNDGTKSDTSVAEFYLSDSCETSMSKLDIRKKSGPCMILTMPNDTSSMLCYQIDYIDDKHLVLLSHGKTLGYNKK